MIELNIENIVLNIALIIFPIIMYLLIVCYQKNVLKKYNELILDLSLITSLFLCLRFGYIEESSRILLFCNIPIIISFVKKRDVTATILALCNVTYCYFIYKPIVTIVVIKYICYFILYLIAKKKRLKDNNFVLSIAVIQAFFLSFEYFFQSNSSSINDLIIVLTIVFIYYFATFLIIYMFRIIETINSLNNTIKDLEKDKHIKNALFKLTHEIKNPLAVCKGYLDIIDINKKEKAEKYLNIMRGEINRSLDIMQEFLEFNKIKIKKEIIDINYLIEDVYNAFKILVNNRKIKIKNESSEDEIYIEGDYERLKQVLVNLLKNSVEAITDDGNIVISTDKNKNYVSIFIRDDGIGMNDEELERISEMFYTTKQNGTGLGVALSNEIIKAHNGKIIYTSEYNKGTCAEIRLPYK